MNIRIDTIQDRGTWDDFIQRNHPHSFLHTWGWGEFQENLGHTICRLGIFDGETLAGVALVVVIVARRGTFLFCPHGPLFTQAQNNDNETYFAALVDHMKKIARAQKASFIRISPLALDTPDARGLYKKNGFRPAPIHMHVELAWMLDITSSDDALTAGMRKTTRHSIKKAEQAGVVTEISNNIEDLKKFHAVYLTTVNRQNFTPFSFEYLEKEFRAFAKNDNVFLAFGHYQNEIVSAAYIVVSNDSAFYHHGASTHGFPNVPVSHLVQWAAIREAKRRGLSMYNFWGIAPEGSGPEHPWAGLTVFKKGFGGFPEQYLHAQDLVLNMRYWLNYTVERIRKSRRRL